MEAPSHLVTVDGFWIDVTPVTNRQFDCEQGVAQPSPHQIQRDLR
jgi:formylglycine-generating enzyme required for sulfatase activity